MNTTWKLQDAKAKFSKIVDDALKIGPQFVTRRGQKAVVVVSVEEYESLVSNKPSFKEFLLSCPKMGDDFEINRPQDLPRSIEF
ncbi:MAG: type II toxin-antitoxin system prevent-host-death family antitoxin [Pseudomonadota bacterium]|nr:type II toxin-antitoxin system prevent-host-death family antitoxin [Pseudomonadota bacterium]